ncbi:hypothetical protein CesoFtcFv8_026956 [Champsocephalus esox]|uniref:Uncharacterized protein n=2 Tax=Champsocephalus TaxID=52236 RepID=A0AAN8GW35_CHAGU|nr:hypothetical protein CesoFtcFv8_026956 [Champsocephalus esox]KAK5893601.1 hypothetical protein CgunFtcFv8_006460 [Champsocephalus gunnari]
MVLALITRCFFSVRAQWRREVKPKQVQSPHEEGACGDSTPHCSFPPAPGRCHRARQMMEHSHSQWRER